MLVLVLVLTSLRWGEAAALRVRNVDTLRRRIAVAESMTEVHGMPRTHQRRTVPVPAFLVDDLAAACTGKSPDELVFPTQRGTVLRVGNFRRDHFDAAAERASLKGLTPHERRHNAASLAIASGASVKDVQGMLGHASAAMTLDVCGHSFGDELDAVADRLDAAARYRGNRADQTRTGGGRADRTEAAAHRLTCENGPRGHPALWWRTDPR
jgi:integrase